MIIRNKNVLAADGGVLPQALLRCLDEHAAQAERLERLRAYYEGRHAIEGRMRASGLPNSRLAHGFPRYISTMAAGYLIGDPVRYIAVDPEQRAALQAVTAAYARCAIDSVDAELARDASVYGRGVELVFADGQAEPRSAALEPGEAFVVYDDTVEARPLFGVHTSPRLGPDGAPTGRRVDVYTDTLRLRYDLEKPEDIAKAAPTEVRRHFFGSVPLVEYWNDEDERGDFEGVLSLIDAYDELQSDRVNDKRQFVDALLLLYGCTLETDERGRTPGQQLREDKALALPDSDAHAEWLCKQLNEADTEILRQALKQDIHKMSLVPDLTDEQFASNISGVAMRYKLLGLEQLTRIKERWFREGLRARLGLYACFMRRKGFADINPASVRIQFTRALPVNELEIAQTLRQLDGIVDPQMLKSRAEAAMGDK